MEFLSNNCQTVCYLATSCHKSLLQKNKTKPSVCQSSNISAIPSRAPAVFSSILLLDWQQQHEHTSDTKNKIHANINKNSFLPSDLVLLLLFSCQKLELIQCFIYHFRTSIKVSENVSF